MEAPDLAGDENGGIRLSYGHFDGEAHSIAFTAAGVVGRDLLKEGDRLTLDIGVGAGFSNGLGRFSSSQNNVFGGRAGVQWTW